MPTINPRITVTLNPKSAAQLRELATLTEQSQSSIIAEIVEASDQVFQRMILILRAAAQAKQAVKTQTAANLTEAQEKVEAQLGLMLEEMDNLSQPLLADLERVARRARKASPGARRDTAEPPRLPVSTPISNRGVRLTTKTQKNTYKTRT